MKLIGNLNFIGGGQITDLKVEVLASDPSTPAAGRVWFNSTDGMYRGYDGTEIVDLGRDELLQAEVDAIETAVGINTDGTYTAPSGTNYIDAATSVRNEAALLDAQAKANADAIASNDTDIANLQTELDDTQTGAGLGTDGTYTANASTNYMKTSTSLVDATEDLDAQVKTNADAIAQNASDIADNVTAIATKVSKAGDTMTGNLNMGGSNTVTGLSAPANADDAATKGYTDALLSGLDFQPDVLDVQVDNSLDVTGHAEGDRYIISNAIALHASFGTITGIEDGDIVESNGTTFDIVYDVSEVGEGAIAWNRAADSFWVYAQSSWSAFGGLAGVTAGAGLEKSGNTIWVNMGAGIAELPTDEVGIDVFATGGLITTEDGTSSSTAAGAQLGILLNGSSMNLSASGLKVADAGVTETQLNASVAGNGITGGAGTALSVVANTGIVVDGSGVAFDEAYGDGRYINTDGDTMTGTLILAGAPTDDLEASTKKYVDDEITTLAGSLNANDYVFTQAVAATSHTVTHNIGQQYCNVTVVDQTNGQVIIPDSITFNSSTQLTVTFGTATACVVIVHGNGSAGTN
jgi:hypothetical protein